MGPMSAGCILPTISGTIMFKLWAWFSWELNSKKWILCAVFFFRRFFGNYMQILVIYYQYTYKYYQLAYFGSVSLCLQFLKFWVRWWKSAELASKFASVRPKNRSELGAQNRKKSLHMQCCFLGTFLVIALILWIAGSWNWVLFASKLVGHFAPKLDHFRHEARPKRPLKLGYLMRNVPYFSPQEAADFHNWGHPELALERPTTPQLINSPERWRVEVWLRRPTDLTALMDTWRLWQARKATWRVARLALQLLLRTRL